MTKFYSEISKLTFLKKLIPFSHLPMCGRFALARTLSHIRRIVNARQVNQNGLSFTPSNNIAPQTPVPVVANGNVDLMMWGIQRKSLLINVRSETVIEKFNSDVSNRRGVIPADGYFEWSNDHQPFFFYRDNQDMMFLASIFTESNQCVILTRSPIASVACIHHRMPLILSLDQIALWQSPNWRELLTSNVPSILFHPVSSLSLRPGSNGPECIAPLTKAKTSGQKKLEDMLKPKSQKIIENAKKLI